jgi:hypothetical protein
MVYSTNYNKPGDLLTPICDVWVNPSVTGYYYITTTRISNDLTISAGMPFIFLGIHENAYYMFVNGYVVIYWSMSEVAINLLSFEELFKSLFLIEDFYE